MRRLIVRFGIWLLLGLLVLVWELTGVRAVCARLGLRRSHESLSALEWKLPLAGRLTVAAFLADLIVHFLFETPLLPPVR